MAHERHANEWLLDSRADFRVLPRVELLVELAHLGRERTREQAEECRKRRDGSLQLCLENAVDE